MNIYNKKLIITSTVIVSLFTYSLVSDNSDLIIVIYLLPAIWMFFYKNIAAKWFWISFLVTSVLLGLNIENAFIQTLVVSINLPSLIFAMRRTFFVRRKNVKIAKQETDISKLKEQLNMAETLYKESPELAMRIALGQEKAPEGILASAIYTKVCDVAEKSEDTETSMKLGNSFHNSKISAEAQELNFRSPYSAIEVMKDVVNARREAFEKTLPKGKTLEDVINEEVENAKKEIGQTKLTKKDMAEVMEDFIDSVKEHTK